MTLPLEDVSFAPAALTGRLVCRVWTDETFKRSLLTHPRAAMAEVGITLPQGATVRVIEEGSMAGWDMQEDGSITLILPGVPTEVSEEDLGKVAAGFTSFDTELFSVRLTYPT